MANSVPSKLRIQFGDVSLDIEGETALVREVYQDFREHLRQQQLVRPVATPSQAAAPQEGTEDEDVPKRTRRKSGGRRQARVVTSPEGKAEKYEPTVLKNLDTPGLQEYYAQWQAKSHPEKVLLFAMYLREQGHDPCTADQIFTCYFKLKIPRPKVFVQALRDAHGKKHSFIEYASPEEVKVTTIGEDHLWHHMAKAEAA